MTLTWNIVTKNITPHEQLQQKFREKIVKLEKHLQHFPPDAVHLQIALERHTRKPVFTAALTLRVPSNILRSEKSAAEPVGAFDHAVRALLRELSDLKSELSREHQWQRKGRRTVTAVAGGARFAPTPLPGGAGPQNLSDVVGDLLQETHSRLLRYLSRQLAHQVRAGQIRRDAVDARAILDETARQALSSPQRKPDKWSYQLWLYKLARTEMTRRLKQIRERAATDVSLDQRQRVADETAAAYGADQLLEILDEQREPAAGRSGQQVTEDEIAQPDELAATSDLLRHLHSVAARWPKQEREVFELYFVEGFDPDEIAMIEKLTPSQVTGLIEAVQSRLRDSVVEAAETIVSVATPPPSPAREVRRRA